MKITRLLPLYLAISIAILTNCASSDDPKMTELPLIVKDSGNHIVHFSNKAGSFWAAETRRYQSHWSTGYVSHRERIFGDVSIEIDNVLLPREQSTIYFNPVQFERRYPAGISEQWFIPDGKDMLVLTLPSSMGTEATIKLDDVALDQSEAASLGIDSNLVSIPLRYDLNKIMHVHVLGSTITSAIKVGQSSVEIDLAASSEPVVVIFQTGGAASEIRSEDVTAWIDSKSGRILALVDAVKFQTDDVRLNDAFKWAVASFDALNMDEQVTGLGKGIYAGYPWFQDYWGRDSFIALRALTATGQYELAAQNLEAFLRFQNLDTLSNEYGKIPNRVRPGDIIYNTADATPRLIIEADRYISYSGDTAFARRVFPNIDAAIRGTLAHRTDVDALLKHGPADTWMDAVGAAGPFSPRGDKAVDIQALWIDALAAASNIARFKRGAEADQLVELADLARSKALESFQVAFRNPSFNNSTDATPVLFDAVGAGGAASSELRPNALFAAHLVSGTQPKRDLVEQVTGRLGTSWGLMSLDPADPKYLPYHKAEPLYDQDASYHNGIVWLWNSGIWIEMLLRLGLVDQAWNVTRNYVDIIHDNITLGTLPELIDAKPREGEFVDVYPDAEHFMGISRLDQMSLRNEAGVSSSIPALSGTWSQAWSLSEFLRNITEDYLGIRYEQYTGFVFKPMIPDSWGNVLATRNMAGYDIEFRRVMSNGTSTWMLRIDGQGKAVPIDLICHVPGMEHPVVLPLTGGEQRIEFRESRGRIAIIVNNEVIEPDPAPPSIWLE